MTCGPQKIKKNDCTNTGDKLRYVCRWYREFESELCIPKFGTNGQKIKETEDNVIVH